MLLGPSGCGKSTLLRTVNRLVPLTRDAFSLDGDDITERDPVELRRGIGYAIQAVGLFAHMTVAQNIAVVPSLLGWSRARRSRNASTSCCAWSGSIPHAIATAGRASSRAARRSASASPARIAARPRALLMDEPFGAVDALVRTALQRELVRIVASWKRPRSSSRTTSTKRSGWPIESS